jgi:hypothetical protein
MPGLEIYNATAQEAQCGGLQTILSQTPIPCPVSTTSDRHRTRWTQTYNGGSQEDYQIYVKDFLYQAALVLGWGLCVRGSTSLLFPPPRTSR